jgi:ABC-type multidrug transport system ATPase subunit
VPYAARDAALCHQLRLGGDVGAEEKYAMVTSTLRELDLAHVADNRTGSGESAGGLSGGHKRRLTVAIELVTSPGLN